MYLCKELDSQFHQKIGIVKYYEYSSQEPESMTIYNAIHELLKIF